MPEGNHNELLEWAGEVDSIRTEMQAAINRQTPAGGFGIYATRLERLAANIRNYVGTLDTVSTAPTTGGGT